MIAETTRDNALTAAANGRKAYVICQKRGYPETVNLTEFLEKVLTEQGNIFLAETEEKEEKVNKQEQASAQPEASGKRYPHNHGGRPSDLDDGKIMALHRAGWNSVRIAGEMGVEQSTIRYHLKRLREEGQDV